MFDPKSCEHLDKLVDVLVEEPWARSENFQCRDCGYKDGNLWMCLLGDCLHVGCSESHLDHSTAHYNLLLKHCVHMNLTTKRVWCYVCNREVFTKAALSNAPKNDSVVNDQMFLGSNVNGKQLRLNYVGGPDKGRCYSDISTGLRRSSLGKEDVWKRFNTPNFMVIGERIRISRGLENGPVPNGRAVNESQESSEGEDSMEEEKPRGLVGLQNIGNTCYMNSAIQALSNTPPLTQYFLDCAAAVDFLTDTKKQPGLSRSYQKLVQDIWNKGSRDFVVPNNILYGIRNVHPMFRGYHQHDTQEFLRCFMDQLHEELKEPVRGAEPSVGTPAVGYINRQPKQARVSDIYDSTREQYITRQPSSTISNSTDNIPIKNKDYYSNEYSQSENNFGFKKQLLATSSHRRSVSYCLLPQDVTKDEPMSLEKQSSVENETEGEDEEENYETCDSGVSDSAEMSGEEYQRTRTVQSEDQRLNIDGPSNAQHDNNDQQGSGDRPSLRYRSVISDVFDGKLLSSVQCLTCDRISTRVETFQDLSLPIPSRDHMAVLHGGGAGSGGNSPAQSPGRGVACSDAVISASQAQEGWLWWLLSWLRSWLYGPAVTLQDCLAAFFSADELKGDNMYSCEKCNKLRNGIKYSNVLSLPEVLCIHLKRFRHELMFSTKIGSKVSFPLLGLDMKPFIHKDCKSAVTVYDLAAVICHAGTAGGGHYTCVARNCSTNNWFQFDDQYVTAYTPQQVANCEAYVLFYIKSNPKMVSLRNKAMELSEATSELNDIKFYISKQWINRFKTYAEPGPIDNGDFLCEHGCVAPDRVDIVAKLTMEISQPLWEFYYRNFGGGPACNHLHVCEMCRAAAERLRERQNLELQEFIKRNNSSHHKAIYAISMNWFRSWQVFVHQKTQQPPPPIDNSSIVTSSSSENTLGRVSSPPKVTIKAGSDYAQINEDCWRLFHGIYGGGPEVKLKSAPKSISTGYSSASELHSNNYNSFKKTRNSVSFTSNYDQFVNKQSDSEDSMDQPNTKSLSNMELMNIANRNGDVFEGNVKCTQSLQDVSYQNNIDNAVMRMSIDSDASVENEPPQRAVVIKNQATSNSKINNKKNTAQKSNSNTRANAKQKTGKGNRKRNIKGGEKVPSNSLDPAIGDTTVDLNRKPDGYYDHVNEINAIHSKKDITVINHNHVDENNIHMNIEESSKPELVKTVGSAKGRKNKVKNLSADVRTACSSLQAVEMSDGDSKQQNIEVMCGPTNSLKKHSNCE